MVKQSGDEAPGRGKVDRWQAEGLIPLRNIALLRTSVAIFFRCWALSLPVVLLQAGKALTAASTALSMSSAVPDAREPILEPSKGLTISRRVPLPFCHCPSINKPRSGMELTAGLAIATATGTADLMWYRVRPQLSENAQRALDNWPDTAYLGWRLFMSGRTPIPRDCKSLSCRHKGCNWPRGLSM